MVNNQLAFPNADSINDVFINGVFNTDWNASGGSFGFDTATNRAFVNATSTPSFFGAALFNITDNHFSAKIDIAPLDGGSTFTAMVIKADEVNYVSMYVDYTNTLRAVSVSSNIPELSNITFPTYDPVAHAYWKISNDNRSFIFWTSPDSVTWTQLVSFQYFWNTRAITVNFISGFNSSNESSLRRAYISVVNSTVSTTPLTATIRGINGIGAQDKVTDPNALSARVSGFSGTDSSFNAIGGLPEGGMTDMSMTTLVDAARFRYTNFNYPTVTGGGTVNWVRPTVSAAVSTHYRDGSYWPTVHSVYPAVGEQAPTDINPVAITNVQVENVPGPFNRLNTNAAFYTESCLYVPQQANTPSGTAGSISVTRSKDVALGGDYSGKMVFGGTAVLDSGGNNVYYPYPTKAALTPIIYSNGNMETIRGTVYLSTTRAGTQWYPALVLYDANFQILQQSTFLVIGGPPPFTTHPGSGIWQQASIKIPATASPQAVWAGIVPVVVSSGSAETVYMSGHTIQGITPDISSAPTTYNNPRELEIVLKPDRLNYAKNSGFMQNIYGWTTGKSGITAAPSASDSFNRTVSNGWGTADIGGSWTTSGGSASDYNVGALSGHAEHNNTTASVSRNTILTAPVANQDIRVGITTLTFAVSGSSFGGVVSRWVDSSNFYEAKVEFNTSHQILLSISKRVGGTDTVLAGPVLTSLTQTIGGTVRLRFQVIGTALKARIWMDGTSEPSVWTLTATDSTFASAGSYGCRSIVAGSVPYGVYFDTFLVNGTPMSLGWDPTVGFNSLGSLKVDAITPPPTYTGTGKIGAVSTLINNGVSIFPLASDLVIGQIYTISAYVKPGPGCPDILMDIVDPNYNGKFNTSLTAIKNSDPTATVSGWTRMSTTFIVPPDGSSDYGLRFQVSLSDLQTYAPFSYWIDSIMIEKGSLLQSYFDGSFATADYQYENNIGYINRSYYYKNFLNKKNRVLEVINDYIPLGSTINLQYGITP